MGKATRSSEFSGLPVKEILKLIEERIQYGDQSTRQTKKVFEGINQIFKIFLAKKGETIDHKDSLMTNMEKLMVLVMSLNKEDKQIVLKLLQIIETRKKLEYK